MSKTVRNTKIIEIELKWLEKIIKQRIAVFINQGKKEYTEPDIPDITGEDSFYADFVNTYDLTPDERKVLMLALAPEVKPELLDSFLVRNTLYDKIFTEFGGVFSKTFSGFLPTIKTALFVLGGHTVNVQLQYIDLVLKPGKLYAGNILQEIKNATGDPVLHNHLAVSDNTLSRVLTGNNVKYEYSVDFPAHRLTTLMEWEDLVLPESTCISLSELLAWPDHGNKLFGELDMGKNIQPGYRALFYGPSGTGKTLTASLIGKKAGKPIYRIDLSQLVSKYIGETEKNLEKIFKTAANRDWILFFDEADALFGKRTSIGSSNDRFANQETAYLLQRIEVCENIVILASNLKANIDPAFSRRFQSVVYFPMPQEEERYQLWQGVFTDKVILDDAIDLKQIAKDYDIAGGSIVNVARYACLMALSKDTVFITHEDLMEGLRREYAKLGRTL